MKVVLATYMPILHTGGTSTHFELLARSLDTAGMLAGRIVGQDGAPSKMRQALCALRAFGGKDAIRVELLRERVHLLARSIDGYLASASADLVHCHDALATYAAVNAPAVKERGLPVVPTVPGPWSRETLTHGVSADSLFYAAAATAVAVPVALGAPQIMRLYGRGFQQGWLVLVLSAATAVISCTNGVVGTAILSAGSVWVGCAFNSMWAAVLLAGCYCFIPTSLALGLAGSMLGAYIAHTAWQAVYLRHRLSRS